MLYVLFLWGIIELFVIVLVAGAIGAMKTLALLLLGMFAGSMILKRERQHLAHRMQRGGQVSLKGTDMKDSLFRVMGGTLLFMPGFISDGLAIVCMIPALRGAFGGLLMKVFRPDVVVERFGYRQQYKGNVYDGDIAANDDTVKSTSSSREDRGLEGELIEHKSRSSKRED